MTDEDQKQFLFLGDSDGGAAASQLSVADIPYIKKRLESGVANWQTIVGILGAGSIMGVLVKLNTRAMERMAKAEYADIREALFHAIAAHPHIVFVHESFYYDAMRDQSAPVTEGDGAAADHDDWFGDDYFEPLSKESTELVDELLDRHGIQVTPYMRNVEINLLAGEFVEQQQRNVLFRFYIPKGRVWARETDAILALFRDYLSAAVHIEVRQTSHSTATGTIYEFSGGAVTPERLSDEIQTFSQVMDLCMRDPDLAERRLVEMGADRQNAGEVVERYTKQLRRLAIDMRQEREKVTLRIRHRLEDELSELLPASDIAALQAVVALIMPEDQSVVRSLGLGAVPSLPTTNALTVNIRPQIINQVRGIVAQEVNGTINLGAGALQMLDLIDSSDRGQAQSLRSAVFELEDPATPAEKKLSAKAKLKAFVYPVLQKGGEKLLEAGGEALMAYVRGTLGI